MDVILRFDGATKRDTTIDAWLDTRAPDLGAIARFWFQRMRACGDDVLEVFHDGCPNACVEDAPFAYVNVFKAHVNVGFFHGADLPDPGGLLEGNGRYMRHVKLYPGRAFDAMALERLIDAAYGDIHARLAPGGAPPARGGEGRAT